MSITTNNRSDDDLITDINITPMVDIILVLLIIFMVTASVIVTPAIKIDLPKAANAEDNPESTFSLVLTKEGKLFLNGKETGWQELQDTAVKQAASNQNLQAIISADKEVTHGEVIHLIDVIKGAGINKFALNIEKIEGKNG